MGKKIQNLKSKIEDYEYYHNGFNHLSGAWVKVKNLIVNKTVARCDVTLCSGEGEPEEKFQACEYPLEKLELALSK